MKSTLQVGVRLHDLEQAPLERRFEIAAEQGFSCIHLASKLIYQEYGIGRDGLTPGLAAHLKRELDRNHLSVAVYGCYLNLANPDPAQLGEILEEYKANIRFASYLGASIVGTETGAPNTGYKFCPECHTQEALGIFIKNVRRAVGYAQQFGVTLAIEPVWKHIVCTPERAGAVLEAVDCPKPQIIFDPVNLLSAENHESQADLFGRMLALNGSDIAVLHAKDYFLENQEIKATAPGETGNMDYSAIIVWQKERKPYLQATIENSTPDNAVRAREYLENL